MRFIKTFSLTLKEATKGMAGWIESFVSLAKIKFKRLKVNKYGTEHIKLWFEHDKCLLFSLVEWRQVDLPYYHTGWHPLVLIYLSRSYLTYGSHLQTVPFWAERSHSPLIFENLPALLVLFLSLKLVIYIMFGMNISNFNIIFFLARCI